MNILLLLVPLGTGSAHAQVAAPGSPAEVANSIRIYRRASETRIIAELGDLLSIPNTATDAADMSRNAARLEKMLERRGFQVQQLQVPDARPVVFGELKTPGAQRTVIFYFHYDGQPVEASSWAGTQPFTPALRTASIASGGKLIPFPGQGQTYQDDWRIYARSAADDKSPIVALLSALDALRDRKIPLAINVKVVLDGEEEAGSPHLEQILMAHRQLLGGDLLISGDGPVHQSGRPQLDFGNRGIVSMRITVYGPLHPLHSGHYGNWAPNPAMRLAQLLAGMKDKNGHVLVEGFYDDVLPLGEAEKQAIRDAPANEKELLNDFGLADAEDPGEGLLQSLTEPSLNVDGMESGWNGKQAKTIIPDQATASLDLRLVKNIQPERQVERVIAHIRKQGYTVLNHEPTMEERLKFARIAFVTHQKGYPAAATSMELPVSRALEAVVDEAAGEPAVRLPILGGSIPMYIFENLHLPVIGVPIVNFDDNQHSPNENVRVGNLWRGMEIYGAIMAGLHW